MKEAFLKFISQKGLCDAEDRILLGVSGGVDSMVMAYLFVHGGFEVGIAHVNYGLRGEDSIRDELIALDFAKTFEVPIYIQKVDPESLKEGGSLQMNAREIRYQFFEEIASRERYQKIATAHQLDDSLETILLNLTKGTGISGVKGIPVANGKVIRPMQFTYRAEIEHFAIEHGILWGEDVSNASNKYQRNLIRNEVIPILKQINPALLDTFVDTQVRLLGAHQIVEAAKADFLALSSRYEGEVWIMDTGQVSHSPYWLALISEVLSDYGFNFSQVKDICTGIVSGQSGLIFYSEDFELNVDRKRVLVRRVQKPTEEEILTIDEESPVSMAFGHKITLQKVKGATLPSTRDIHIAFLDASKVRFPLTLRRWRNGDRFVPLGMKGRKMVSDFMIDHKIPVTLKRDIYVLLSGEEIVWLVNHRISDLFKVTPETPSMLKITVERS